MWPAITRMPYVVGRPILMFGLLGALVLALAVLDLVVRGRVHPISVTPASTGAFNSSHEARPANQFGHALMQDVEYAGLEDMPADFVDAPSLRRQQHRSRRGLPALPRTRRKP